MTNHTSTAATKANDVERAHLANQVAYLTSDLRHALEDDNHPAVKAMRSHLFTAIASHLPSARAAVLAEHGGAHPDGYYRMVCDRAYAMAFRGLKCPECRPAWRCQLHTLP